MELKSLSLNEFKNLPEFKGHSHKEICESIIELVKEGQICPIHDSGWKVLFTPTIAAKQKDLEFKTLWLENPYFELQ